jgi:DNA-binding CsgD family transcriptional regulator
VCILRLRGLTSSAAGRQLGISRHTVHSCWLRIYEKLHVQGQMEALMLLFRVALSTREAPPSRY